MTSDMSVVIPTGITTSKKNYSVDFLSGFSFRGRIQRAELQCGHVAENIATKHATKPLAKQKHAYQGCDIFIYNLFTNLSKLNPDWILSEVKTI